MRKEKLVSAGTSAELKSMLKMMLKMQVRETFGFVPFSAEQPGAFSVLPARVETMYAPELKANPDNKVKVKDK